MKIKTTTTVRLMMTGNPFKITKEDLPKFQEVVVRAYVKDGESVTMSFPVETLKYRIDSPSVKDAIKKCVDMTTDSLVKYLGQRKAKEQKSSK